MFEDELLAFLISYSIAYTKQIYRFSLKCAFEIDKDKC